VIVGAICAWTQCTVNVKATLSGHRTAFSIAAEVLTMWATGWSTAGSAASVLRMTSLAAAAVVAAYRGLRPSSSTGLVACSIAYSTRHRSATIWRNDLSLSGRRLIVAGKRVRGRRGRVATRAGEGAAEARRASFGTGT